MHPKQKLSAAFMLVEKVCPYLTTGLSHFIRKEAPIIMGMETFASSKAMVLLWTPGAVEKWDVDEIGGVLVHELFHPTRQHFDRAIAAGYDGMMANIAEDMESNDDIVKI